MSTDYIVADLQLADWGRKELSIAETEMPGLMALRDEFGPETLSLFAGTRTGTLTRKGYMNIFAQMWGTPNFGDTEAFCSEAKNVSFESTTGMVGSGNSYTETDLGSASLYVYFGDNQAESRPVHFGMINDWKLKNGARMIVADPRLTVTASKADRWLPIRAGRTTPSPSHSPAMDAWP